MKTRNGFVSNSSSSSFIVGIGKVKNPGKFHKYLSANGLTGEVKTVNVKDLPDNRNWDVKREKNRVVVSSFMEEVAISNGKLDQDDTIVYVNIIKDEGDCGVFEYDEDTGSIDYDIDLDYFNDTEQRIFNMFKDPDSGIDTMSSTVTFGAGRNG